MTPATSFVSKPSEAADAVVLVDDVVARAQVGEGLERAAEPGLAPRALAKDLRVGEERQPELTPDEAAAGRRDREAQLRLTRRRLARLEQLGLGAPQQALRAQRVAAMRERDDDTQPGPDERGELVLGLGEPARRERRPLRLERERLSLRERVELRGAGRAAARRSPRSSQSRRTSSGCQTRSGTRSSTVTRSDGARGDSSRSGSDGSEPSARRSAAG